MRNFQEPDVDRQIQALLARLLCAALVLLGCGWKSVRGQDPPRAGKAWAILIGVQRYEKVPPLPYIDNDIRELKGALVRRGGYEDRNIVVMVDAAPRQEDHPTRQNILANLPLTFARIGADDTVLFYFSGHGFKDAEGRLHLVPRDGDPVDPAGTFVGLDTIKQQIAACPARFKLLVIDSCHAGAKAIGDAGNVPASELGERFGDLEQVLTLTSSTANELSQIWETKRQSLFSYWLVQGLKGHADADGNSEIKAGELTDYVYRNVRETAERNGMLDQTPLSFSQRIEGEPVIVKLRPARLTDVLDDVAEQFSTALDERKLPAVATLEFTNQTELGPLLSSGLGPLGAHCQSELQQRLVQRSTRTSQFAVIDYLKLRSALSKLTFNATDLGSDDKLARLGKELGDLPVLALGNLTSRGPRQVGLNCQLKLLGTQQTIAQAGGLVYLTEEEWGLLGHSAPDLPPAARAKVRQEVAQAVKIKSGAVASDEPADDPLALPDVSALAMAPETEFLVEEEILSQRTVQAEQPHPLSDPAGFPFDIQVVVRKRDARGNFLKKNGRFVMVAAPHEFRGNRFIVGFRKGDVYALNVRNRTGETAVLKLLVDGLNTLPLRGETELHLDERQWGQPVSLTDLPRVRGWVLEAGSWTQYAGFATATGAEGNWRLFTVVDAAGSLAQQRGFASQLGTLTLGFYSTGPGTRGDAFGTQAGQSEQIALIEKSVQAGDLRSIVTIHYVDYRELANRPVSTTVKKKASSTKKKK